MYMCPKIHFLPSLKQDTRQDKTIPRAQPSGSDLQQEDELGETLDGLHHQAVEGDPVCTGGLLLLGSESNRIRLSEHLPDVQREISARKELRTDCMNW